MKKKKTFYLIAAALLYPQWRYKKSIQKGIDYNYDPEEHRLYSFDGFPLYLRHYPHENPKALIQIVHGALEHGGRYEKIAQKLQREGYALLISDHRGHGRSTTKEYPLGHMKDVEEILQDLHMVTLQGKQWYPGVKTYMIGHSMGSILARLYLQQRDHLIDKLVLTGTVPYHGLSPLGVMGARMINTYLGERKFYSWMSPIPKGKDWLSYNEKNRQEVLTDPFHQEQFDNRGNLTLFEANQKLKDYRAYQCKNPTLPILSLTGDEDVVTGGKEGIEDSLRTLSRVGYRKTQFKIYPHMKHEVLQEKDNEEVLRDLLGFFHE